MCEKVAPKRNATPKPRQHEEEIDEEGLDPRLAQCLAQQGLDGITCQLLDYGAKNPEDVLVLTLEDLRACGLKTVQVRALQAAIIKMPRKREGSVTGPALTRTLTSLKRQTSPFWQRQIKRPRRLVFVRHGESEANVNRTITTTVPDYCLHLTERGREQALDAGVRLRSIFKQESVMFIYSPYTRTQETLNGILRAWEGEERPKTRPDVRIREQEFGNYDGANMREMQKEKKSFGPFFYRFANGESPADCYDRASSFLESMYRQWEDNEFENQVIVGHGLMNLVLLMRLCRIPVQDFNSLDSLKNCEFVVLTRPEDDTKLTIEYMWAPGEEKSYGDLRRMDASNVKCFFPEIWDGDPAAPLLVSSPSSPSHCSSVQR